MLAQGFYIGSWHQEWDGVQVVSWAAPVASLFYQGRRAIDAAANSVVGRRTFVIDHSDIVNYVDDLENEGRNRDDPFSISLSRKLNVPPPPAPASPPLAAVTPSEAVPPKTSPALSVDVDAIRPHGIHEQSGQRSQGTSTAVSGETSGGLRAEEVVRAVLERPRTGHLASVLATLQADQYGLVTWPATEPLVVQGGPGTGKTIIAVHRAAYLSHPEREPTPLNRIAFFGPTSEYVDYVGGVINELRIDGAPQSKQAAASGSVEILSLGSFLRDRGGLTTQPKPERGERLDGDWKLGRFVTRAVATIKAGRMIPPRRRPAVHAVVDAMIQRDHRLSALFASDPEIDEWLSRLGSYEKMSMSQRYVPFLAAVGWAVQPPPENALFDQIICDEAQDIRPLEWFILAKHLTRDGQFSLFGDINQRRSDWSAESWESIGTDLRLTDESGHLNRQDLELGYRTTRQIVRYANQLLPVGQRTAHAIRSGPEPMVRKATKKDLMSSVVFEAAALSLRHAGGRVAVISPLPQNVSDAFRRAQWSRSAIQNAWQHNGSPVQVLHPDLARGLEFDAVIVVEPADFPPNLGRRGQLYTSLTRAVHELVVVHSVPVPKELRTPSR
jgi:DNA helicase IV